MFKRRRYKTRQSKKEEEIEEEINKSTDNVITKEPTETLSPSDFLPPINTRNKPCPPPRPKRKSSIESSIDEIIENNNLLEKTEEKEKKPRGIFGLSLFSRNKQKDIEVPENIKKSNTSDNNNEEKINNDLKNLKINNENNQQLLTDILNNDEKLLFSLNALGSLQKDEKLTEKDNLLTVDDRWLFQGLRRWWSEDSRKKSSNKTLIVISTVTERINKLLEEDYLDKIKEENKPKTTDPLSEDGLDFQGIDMRNPVLSDLDNNLLYEIGVNMKKLSLLQTLEDDKVGLPRKLKMLEDNYLLNDTLGVNILNAGLLNDWDFDII